MTKRRYRGRLTTPEAVYWTPAVEASGMLDALRSCAELVVRTPGMPRAADALAANEPGWHLAVLPEEDWAAAMGDVR